MCRGVFYLAAFLIPDLPQCIILSCWKQIFTCSIPPSGVTWVSHSVVVVSHWLTSVSHRSSTKYHTQLYCRDLFLYLSWLPECGESLQVGGGRFLGPRESVPHHLVPFGMSLRNSSVTSSSWVEFRSCRVEVLQTPLTPCVCGFIPPLTRALTLGVSWTFPASQESGGTLGNNWLLGLCVFLKDISKDTRKAVVKLPLQPQPSPVFVMSPGWVSAWLSCPEGSGRGTHSVLSFERKKCFFPILLLIVLRLKLVIYKCVR